MAGIFFDLMLCIFVHLIGPRDDGCNRGDTFIPFEENHFHNNPNQQSPGYIDNFPGGFEEFGNF